jgi:hypothetical protein
MNVARRGIIIWICNKLESWIGWILDRKEFEEEFETSNDEY